MNQYKMLKQIWKSSDKKEKTVIAASAIVGATVGITVGVACAKAVAVPVVMKVVVGYTTGCLAAAAASGATGITIAVAEEKAKAYFANKK